MFISKLSLSINVFPLKTCLFFTTNRRSFSDIMEDIIKKAEKARQSLLPSKSEALYQKEYNLYLKWLTQRNVMSKDANETVFLAYFQELSETFSPNSLWTKWSMLKSMVTIYEKRYITKFNELEAFLKRKSKGYKPKKSAVLSPKDVIKFLKDAPNEIHLLHKDQNNHIIKVINFKHQDVVTHPIIKLIGIIQNTPSTTCRTGDPSVHLYVNGATVAHSTTHLVHGKFKLLAELQEGENLLRIEHCCRHLVMELGLQVERRTRCVVPLYVVCHGDDGHFQAPPSTDCGPEGACRRITLGAKMLQCVTAEKMIERGLGRKTFDLEGDCRVFQSRMSCLEARSMKPTELWENIGREIMKSPIGSENKKYLAFLSCTRYLGSKYDESMKTHEDFLKITEGYVALGGGGLAIFGTACLYTWPEHFQDIIERFEDETPVDKTRFLDDSCYRGTLGACFSTTLGSVLHELYHTFDLGHTQHGIMGRGFDNIHRVFTKSDLATCDPPEAQRALREAIEFKEALEPSASASICRGENARKEFTVHGRFEEVDDTLLAENCAVILCYHKWFNCGERTSILTFDSSNKLVKSTAGVRVVEIRSPHTELVLHYWVFVGRVVKFSFQLPQEVIETCDGDYIVFVEDGIGSILKENVRI